MKIENDFADELIYRADVNRIICAYRDEQADKWNERNLERAYGANEVGRLISELPSVEYQAPMTGEWRLRGELTSTKRIYECSECGRPIVVVGMEGLSLFPYCHCGARMTGEKSNEKTE